MNLTARAGAFAAFVLYTFVILEFLYMITPFLAFYYYAEYGQFLGFLNQQPWTAWLTTFFLPHFSKTDVEWLEQLAPWGRRLGLVAILGFALTAGQIYWAKLARKGMVRGGVYRFVRHPQYAFLIVLGFATLLIWPRFLILYAFATMTFLYVVLARHEENVCLERFGQSYRDYLRKAGMFFPRLAPASTSEPRRSGWLAAVVFLAISMACATAAGFGLREYSLGAISAVFRQDAAIISPAVLGHEEIEQIADLAANDPGVRALTSLAAPDAQWIIYVVPEAWYLPDLPIDPLEVAAEHGGHGAPRNYDRARWQVLFTTARTWRDAATGRDIVRYAYGKTPVALATLNIETRSVESVSIPPPHVVWGDIPMPMF